MLKNNGFYHCNEHLEDSIQIAYRLLEVEISKAIFEPRRIVYESNTSI